MRLSWSFSCLVGAWCLLIATLGGTLPQARADMAFLNMNLTIITPPECTLNGNSSMGVNFGEVQQGLIDGSYKRMPIDYGLICTSLANNALKMTLNWNNVNLDGSSAIETNLNKLGIAVYHDNTRLDNNASLSFTDGSPPALYVVPVKPSGMMLNDGGSFSGVIRLTLDYQ